MSKPVGILMCALIVLGIAGADAAILLSSSTLSRLVDEKLKSTLGDTLSYTSIHASITGGITLQGVGLQFTDRKVRILSTDRATVSIARRQGSFVAESILMERPRFNISPKLIDELSAAGQGKPLRESIRPEELPRILCKGGILEIVHPDIFQWDCPQAFQIGELALVPTAGYRYLLGGNLKSELFGEWKINGEIDLDTGEHRFVLMSPEIELGPRIRAVVAPGIQAAWDRFQPTGLAQIFVHVGYDRNHPDKKVDFRATLKPVNMGMTYKGFPYKCERVSGEIDFFAAGFQVKTLLAHSGPRTVIRFDGSSDGYDADAAYDFRAELDRVPIDEKLKGSLQKDAQKVIELFSPTGEIDARATVHRGRGPDQPVRIPVDVTLRKASLRYKAFPYELSNAEGEIRSDGTEVIVKHLKGFHGNAEVRINGTIKEIGTDPIVDLAVRAQGLALDSDLRQALSEDMKKTWNQFVPLGAIDMDLRIRRSTGAEPTFKAAVRLSENRMCWKEIAIPVKITEGQIDYLEGTVRLNHLKGDLDVAGTVELSGELIPLPNGHNHKLNIDGKGVPIDDRFKRAMPKELSDLLNVLKLSGEADFRYTHGSLKQGSKESTTIGLALHLRKGVIASDVRIEDIDGEVNLAGEIVEGKPLIQGTIRFHSARIHKRRVTNLTTSFYLQGTKLTFLMIRGDAYGGQLSGTLTVDTRTDEIAGAFNVDRLDLKEFALDTEKFSKKTLSGTVKLEIRNLKGFANDANTMRGDGTISITNGQLLDVPGVVAFLDPSSFGAERRFTTFKAAFDIFDKAFQIKELAFLGEEGSGGVVGRGTVTFDGKFKLKVKTVTGSLFGLGFFLTDLPAKIFDAVKSGFEKTFEGTLDD